MFLHRIIFGGNRKNGDQKKRKKKAFADRANERVFMGFGQNTEEVMIDALSQSQETALLLGTELENV